MGNKFFEKMDSLCSVAIYFRDAVQFYGEEYWQILI